MRPDERGDGSGGPTWIEPKKLPGYGQGPPAGQIRGDIKDLVIASDQYAEMSEQLKKARELSMEGYGLPQLFGALDLLWTASRMHSNFNSTLVNGLDAGRVMTQFLSEGLLEVAKDFTNTDTDTSANFQNLEDGLHS